MFQALKHLYKVCELLSKALGHMFKALEYKFSRGVEGNPMNKKNKYSEQKKEIIHISKALFKQKNKPFLLVFKNFFLILQHETKITNSKCYAYDIDEN